MTTHTQIGECLRISFPTSESFSPVSLQPAPLIRPFRRISLPSFPSVFQKNSIESLSYFGSPVEETRPGLTVAVHNSGNVRLSKLVSTTSHSTQTRFIPTESPKRHLRRRSSGAQPISDINFLKQKQVVAEFYTTEKSYVDGLELIYSHFLSPIIISLETLNPLLDRASLTSIFSNFIDIWNFHRSFFSALTTHLQNDSTSIPPPISPVLLSHFPYLSLYNPFVTSFPSIISTLTDITTPPNQYRPNPRFNQEFATFVSTQEADLCCGKLKLRDWLLTIVQRLPRYLLLLKDLIKNIDVEDPEYSKLNSVFSLVTKITTSLNTSLQAQAQILSLLALQRSTNGLPIQLIEPGRIFIKRGLLFQAERSSAPREREFLLFSDCLLWLANEEVERTWSLGWSASATIDSHSSSPHTPVKPKIVMSRRSEAELMKSRHDDKQHLTSLRRHDTEVPPPMKKPSILPSPLVSRRTANTGDKKWVFKGQISLVDVEVILVPPRAGEDELRFEVLSPESSFVLYAGSEIERASWVSEIRQAKAQLLTSLNVINSNSTLTSSSSTNHLRRSLQALPFPPSDERIATIRAVQSFKDISEFDLLKNDEDQRKGKEPLERRRKVEHWVPAIWIPDEKSDLCMRCSKPFNWRRRRHHCRLCGRCICATCSSRTFFIANPSALEPSSKPARACETCYETVFPLVDPPTNGEGAASPMFSSFLSSDVGTARLAKDTTLAMLPTWVSMPSLPTQGSQPQALMQMADADISTDGLEISGSCISASALNTSELQSARRGHARLRLTIRPKSYHQIPEDFGQQGHQFGIPSSLSTLLDSAIEENPESSESEGVSLGSVAGERYFDAIPLSTPSSVKFFSQPPSPSPRRKREDIVKKSKRFSLPAIALHPTNVTTRTASVITDPSGFGSGGNGNGNGSGGVSKSTRTDNAGGAMGRLRKLSLVSYTRN